LLKSNGFSDASDLEIILRSKFLSNNQQIGSLIIQPNSFFVIHRHISQPQLELFELKPKTTTPQLLYILSPPQYTIYHLAQNSVVPFRETLSQPLSPDYSNKVRQLIEMEFTEGESKTALENSNYDVESAVVYIVDKSSQIQEVNSSPSIYRKLTPEKPKYKDSQTVFVKMSERSKESVQKLDHM
jgi:hypothetical protein